MSWSRRAWHVVASEAGSPEGCKLCSGREVEWSRRFRAAMYRIIHARVGGRSRLTHTAATRLTWIYDPGLDRSTELPDREMIEQIFHNVYAFEPSRRTSAVFTAVVRGLVSTQHRILRWRRSRWSPSSNDSARCVACNASIFYTVLWYRACILEQTARNHFEYDRISSDARGPSGRWR